MKRGKFFMKKQAKEWLKFARNDLQSAKVLVNQDHLTTVVAFHVQQCIEKSFKAILELYNEKVPRVHDLRKLLQLLKDEGINIDFSLDEEVLDQINQVYIDTRYPGDSSLLPESEPSKSKVIEFLDEAEKIYNIAEQRIEEY